MSEVQDLGNASPLLNYTHTDGVEETSTAVHGAYSGLHSAGFRDFFLKPELVKAIKQCGFEHPSEVQQECIPQAILGTDVVCQAKSGMGKTAVFVLSVLQQLEPVDGEVQCLVICHARELAYQIKKEVDRFSEFFDPKVNCEVFFGGVPVSNDVQKLKDPPHIVVGTPGRLMHLVEDGNLKLGSVKFFIVDECDKVLEKDERAAERNQDPYAMRRKVQEIFTRCPKSKQVMMFTATLGKETMLLCKKFMNHPLEVCVDNDSKLKLRNLNQYYVEVKEEEKNKMLLDILDKFDFNQVVIFLSTQQRASMLARLLEQEKFPVVAIHGGMKQEERIAKYNLFKSFKTRILCATDVFGRGMDIEHVNIVFNYDMPPDTDTYLHRVARAGRFDTKGLAITFVNTEKEVEILNKTQDRFDVEIARLPDVLEKSMYMNAVDSAQYRDASSFSTPHVVLWF